MNHRIRINATTAAYAEARGLDTTQILRDLHQGGAPPPGSRVADAGFDLLVLCARNFQPYAKDYPGVRVVRCRLADEPLTERTWGRSTRAADVVVGALKGGERALVTCELGENRSGLVVGQVLCRMLQLSGDEAVRRIRSLRRNALNNHTYAEALRAAWP